VYGIVKQCGGSISVYSELGQGTAFAIYIPQIERGAFVLSQAAPPRDLTTLRGTETILVAEDHEQVRRIAVQVLRDCGYKVLEAADPEDALRQSEGYAGTIDLLLTDVIMPTLSGRQLADRIRGSRPSTQVIFMSAYSEPTIHDRGVLASSVNFIQKPFSPEGLVTKVREVLGPPRSAGKILVVDDEPGVRSYLRKILAAAGYEVFESRHGAEAVQQLQRFQVDLVLTDLAMPEQEGIETIRILRRQHPKLRIVAMSGRFPDLLGVAEHLGADAVTVKPVVPDKLLEILTRLMPSDIGHGLKP
jgi:CheY-like chemotaxis protein